MTRLARWCFTRPLELAGQARSPGDLAAFDRLLATAAHAPGVARATAAQISPDHQAVIATLYPATAPQDQRDRHPRQHPARQPDPSG